MRYLSSKVVVVVIAIATAVPLASQTPPAQKPSFEVATIKPNGSADGRVGISRQPGGRLVVTAAPLKLLIGFAYIHQDFRIFGGPSWIATDQWNIEAKAEEGSVGQPTSTPDPSVPDPMTLMLQSLLEHRFQLKAHRETKELPVYQLVVSKSGPKFKLSEDQTPPGSPGQGGRAPSRSGPVPRGGMRLGRGVIEGNGVTLANLIGLLSLQLGQVVIDKTELKSLYDFKLDWTPAIGLERVAPGALELTLPPPDSGPSLFTAIQEQLGLKLESAKGPVEVFVIDSVQKPSEN